jgi:hypothetical protein
MSSKRVSISPWAPSDLQHQCAEYLAAGYSQKRTAAIVSQENEGTKLPGITQQGISKWLIEQPQYAEYVAEMRRQWLAAQRMMFHNSVGIAQLIYFKALTGECDADDPTVELATKLLDRTLWRHAVPGGLAGDDGASGGALPPGDA